MKVIALKNFSSMRYGPVVVGQEIDMLPQTAKQLIAVQAVKITDEQSQELREKIEPEKTDKVKKDK